MIKFTDISKIPLWLHLRSTLYKNLWVPLTADTITLITYCSLICPNYLPSSEGVCVAQSKYGIGYGVDERMIVVRFLVAAVCCALTHILQIWTRDDITFNSRDTRGSSFWEEKLQKATPIIVGYVASLTWKNCSIWYTWQLKILCTFYSIYTTENFGWSLHNRWMVTCSGHTLDTSPWLRIFSCTAKRLLSKLRGGILLPRRCDLKKFEIYEVIKNFTFCILYVSWI